MKIIFVINDKQKIGLRWANGSIGEIKNVISSDGRVNKVIVSVNNKEYDVLKEKHTIQRRGNDEWFVAGEIINFPFVPAYAITIDKSQGLTLDKAAIVLEYEMRPNQLYVALSRTRSLNVIIILGRKVEKKDIKKSAIFGSFMDAVQENAILVEYSGNIKLQIVNNFNINCEDIEKNIIDKVQLVKLIIILTFSDIIPEQYRRAIDFPKKVLDTLGESIDGAWELFKDKLMKQLPG